MKILTSLWRYWKWVCVALMTSFAVLVVLAALLGLFGKKPASQQLISQCIDNGGIWDDDKGECRSSA